MSFFSRKRQKTAVKKKKWEVDSDDEVEGGDSGEHGADVEADDADIDTKAVDEEEPEMVCRECAGERDADAYCLSCKLYFCIECFAKVHAKPENSDKSDKNGDSTDDKKSTSEDKFQHKLRPLVGGRNLTGLEVGWLLGESRSQAEKKAERDRIQAQKEAEEKARREAEEKERKDKEAKAAAARKALGCLTLSV